MQYVVLLRGINVGGNARLPMAELRTMLTEAGYQAVRTYIQSGNMLLETSQRAETIANHIEKLINQHFGLTVPTVAIDQPRYERIMAQLPQGWGDDPAWKYNLLFLKPPYDIDRIITDMGILKPDIEQVSIGDGVIYQGLSKQFFGRASSGKLPSKPSYKLMTIRSLRTAQQLLQLLHQT